MLPVLSATDSFTVFITAGKGEMGEGYCLDEENCGGQAVSAIAVQFNAILQSNADISRECYRCNFTEQLLVF